MQLALLTGGMDAATQRLADRIEPVLEGLGYALVRLLPPGKASARGTMQVMAERLDDAAMTVDDCARISHALDPVLEAADPAAGSYSLEVSSPGIDRPLTRAADFDRFAGFEVKLEAMTPVDGRKRFRGVLEGLDGEAVRVLPEDGEAVLLPLRDLIKAGLVLNDALLAAAQDET